MCVKDDKDGTDNERKEERVNEQEDWLEWTLMEERNG